MNRTAMTENGMVRGLPSSDARITVYKGIPFAAPPVGENRWRAPQKCENWEGILDAYQYGPIPIQDTPGLGTDVYCREWHVDADIPGDDNLGTFHSVDLWFFFETLMKSPRPFVGRHYDLARNMCNYFANFVKTGDPNGTDSDGSSMEKWLPYSVCEKNEMVFTSDGPKSGVDSDERTRFFIEHAKSLL